MNSAIGAALPEGPRPAPALHGEDADSAAADRAAAVRPLAEACTATGLARLASPLCLPSIARRLARVMSVLLLVGMGLVSVAKYSLTTMDLKRDQQRALDEKSQLIGRFIADACTGGEANLLGKLRMYEPVRGSTRLDLWRGDGTPLFADSVPPFAHHIRTRFEVPASAIAGGKVVAQLDLDTSHDEATLQRLAWTMGLTTLLGVTLVGLAIRWLVRHELRPLMDLARQTRAISPQRLDQRLHLDRPSEELQPWIEQFNLLMERLQRAYAQLEAFNADVAHELRTPLATLIGETELALSRDRDAPALRETLESNLEEVHRLSALVNDMLFLSRADRGAEARRSAPLSLAALAAQVAEFHEGSAEDARLTFAIEGDAVIAVDEPLVKRALSNILGNATRFATPGSTVTISIGPEPAGLGEVAADGAVRVVVSNTGEPIEPQHLPRLFDRFFRIDSSRCCDGLQHHGLGLAIVAAIARMHGGRTWAESSDGQTRIGFSVLPG